MDINLLLQYLDDEHTRVLNNESRYFDTAFKVMPRQYLSFAQQDIESGLEHRYINAITNIRRAVNCQVDRLIKLLLYYNISLRDKWSSQRKLQFLMSMEIITKNELYKMAATRNITEHFYIQPHPEKVMSALSTATEFIDSTEPYASYFKVVSEYTNDTPEKYEGISNLSVRLHYNYRMLVIASADKKLIKIRRDKPEYLEVFKRHLKKAKGNVVPNVPVQSPEQ
jgi:hypothetical protein